MCHPGWPINSPTHVLSAGTNIVCDTVKTTGTFKRSARLRGKRFESLSQLCYKLQVTLDKLISWGCVQCGGYEVPCHPNIHFLKHSGIH